ncbi:MAG: alpha/beta hydrolase [Chloroflexota bacterium]
MKSIEEYLASVGSAYVMPGAAPFFLDKGEIGCLLVHGWAGSCHALRYLGSRLADAGITAYAPLLPGHGTTPEEMARTSALDWVHAVVEHLHLLTQRCCHTFVAGLSMGGTLTLYLGATQGKSLRGIASINGAIFLNNPDFAVLALQADAPPMIPVFPSGLMKDPNVVEVMYLERPTNTILGVLGLTKAVEELLPRITVPTLIIQSTDDGVVPAANAELIYDRIGAIDKRISWLTNSYHVAPLDYDKDIVADELIAFIHSHT